MLLKSLFIMYRKCGAQRYLELRIEGREDGKKKLGEKSC